MPRAKGQKNKNGYKARQNAQQIMSLALACRADTEEALALLRAAIRTPACPWPARIMAALAIMDRGWGKPAQTIEVLHSKELTVNYPTQQEIDAELRKRGMMPVLELVANHVGEDDNKDDESEPAKKKKAA